MGAFYNSGLSGIIDRAHRTSRSRWLERWWTEKYKLPWKTSPLFLNHTREDLLIEFFEDLHEKSPEAIEKLKLEDSKVKNVQFITGDPVIDAIEESIAKEDKIPENIDELLLGEENARRFQEWAEKLQVMESSPSSGGFSLSEEMQDSVEDNLKEEDSNIIPFFTNDKD